METSAPRQDALGRGRAEYATLLALTVMGLFLSLPYRTGLIPALLCALTFREVGRPTRVVCAVVCLGAMAA